MKTIFITLMTLVLFISGLYAKNANVKCSNTWAIFGPIDSSRKSLTKNEISKLKAIPRSLKVAGKILKARKFKTTVNGEINLAAIFYPENKKTYKPTREGDFAYLITELECRESGNLSIGTGADWWMKWFLDGKAIFDTLKKGNQNGDFSCIDYVFDVKISKGKHLIIVMVKSGSGGWKFAGAFNQNFKKQLEQKEKRKKDIRKNAEKLARLRHIQQQKDALINSRMKLVVYGSSVAKGSGATKYFGWGNQLGALLKKRNWEFVNKSVGGDTTTKLLARFKRDMLSQNPNIVIIGLSLANEGILGNSPLIYKRYVRNMRKLIMLCRKHNIIPIIANCYPHNSYSPKHYMYIKKFNELLNTWQVASFDFLGSVGNGAGKWQKECWRDGGHPNDLGHTEMFYSISPSLFDNLIDQYYSIPASDNSWMSCKNSTILSYKPKDTIHSFSMALRVRLQSGDKGNVLAADDNIIAVNKDGHWSLRLENGKTIVSKVKAVIGQEYHIALTSSYANSYVKFYINAKNIGKAKAKLVPSKFSIGGNKALFKDFLLYRSCLSPESIQSLSAGTILRSSLEIYAPLTDKVLTQGILLINSSQTDSALMLKSGSINNIIPSLQR